MFPCIVSNTLHQFRDHFGLHAVYPHCRILDEDVRSDVSAEFQNFLDSVSLDQAQGHMRAAQDLVSFLDTESRNKFRTFIEWWQTDARFRRVCGIKEGTQGFVGCLAEVGNKMLRNGSNANTLLQSTLTDFATSMTQKNQFLKQGNRASHATGPSQDDLASRFHRSAIRSINLALDDAAERPGDHDMDQLDEPAAAGAGGRELQVTLWDSHRSSSRMHHQQSRHHHTQGSQFKTHTLEKITQRQLNNISTAERAPEQFIKSWNREFEAGQSSTQYLSGVRFEVVSKSNPDTTHSTVITLAPYCDCMDWINRGEPLRSVLFRLCHSQSK